MDQPGSASTEKARQALDKLAQNYLYHPAVSLIDIGRDPQDRSGEMVVVLRIHLRPGTDTSSLHLPAEVDGIPVRTIHSDYHLE